MALARVKTWIAGDLLTALDLNNEFNNVLNNPISLISPTTGVITFSTNQTFAVTVTATMVTTGTIAAGGTLFFSTAATPLLDTLAIGTSGQVLTVSTAGKPSWATASAAGGVSMLDAVTANTDVNNTTADTTIYTFSVPGNTIGSTGQLLLRLQGSAQITSNSWRTHVRFGTTAVLMDVSHGAVAIASSTPILTEVFISADGATNAQVSMLSENACSSVAAVVQNMARATSAIDTTGSQTLVVAIEMDTATTSNRYIMQRATLLKIT